MKARRYITIKLQLPTDYQGNEQFNGLRLLLKRLIRTYGLKCIRIGEVDPNNEQG